MLCDKGAEGKYRNFVKSPSPPDWVTVSLPLLLIFFVAGTQ
jgi:hypothetical protein